MWRLQSSDVKKTALLAKVSGQTTTLLLCLIRACASMSQMVRMTAGVGGDSLSLRVRITEDKVNCKTHSKELLGVDPDI